MFTATGRKLGNIKVLEYLAINIVDMFLQSILNHRVLCVSRMSPHLFIGWLTILIEIFNVSVIHKNITILKLQTKRLEGLVYQ